MKIKVLIAEDQKVYQFGLQKMIEQSEAIEIVGIASNGREAIEKVESLKPEIVILDSFMPIMDGVETAKRLALAHSKLKIIFISSSVEYERIALAIEAGAWGYLKKDTLECDLVPAILAIHRDNPYFSPEIIPIIQEGKNSASENSRLEHALLLPSEETKSLLDSWRFCLAKEIISKWRFENKLDAMPREAIEALEISLLEQKLLEVPPESNWQLKTFEQKLVRVVDATEREYTARNSFSVELLDQAKGQVTRWFDDEVAKLRSDSQKLRLSEIDKLNEFIAPYWQKGSPEPLISFFYGLLKQLSTLRRRYQQSSLEFLAQSNGAFNSFSRCSNFIEKNKDSLIAQKHWWSSAFRAIFIGFEYQLRAEIHDAIAQILVGIINSCQFYYDSAIKTNNLLKQVESLLLDDIEPAIAKFDSKIEIEIWIGHRLNQWGNSPSLSPGLIKERLLAKIAVAERETESDFQLQTLNE
jgi:DNA-binding NarL/FixJ family response regulator